MKQVNYLLVIVFLALANLVTAQNNDVLANVKAAISGSSSSSLKSRDCCCDKPNVGIANPSNQTIINEVGVDENGVPTIEFEIVVLREPDERLVFVGPKEFQINFREGSFFIDDPKENPGFYQTKNGVIILRVDRKKVEKLGDRAIFKYDVIVNGVVLDPFAVWARNEN